MEYTAKKLFNGFASVRDYIVKDCIEKRESLVIVYKGDKMTIPFEFLTEWQLHKKEFKSKYGTGNYTLYDYKFIDDETRKKLDEEKKINNINQLRLL